MTPRLKELYYKEIQPALKQQLGFKNTFMSPKLEKVVLNMGLGLDGNDAKIVKSCEEDLGKLSGQKPVITRSKKAISNFKIREKDPVGVSITLRKRNMYEFLERFISIVSPRIRDFRGFSPKGFDGSGNYNFGINEQVIFPEINYDKVNSIRGMNLTFVTSAKDDKSALKLIKSFGFPFRETSKKEVEESI